VRIRKHTILNCNWDHKHWVCNTAQYSLPARRYVCFSRNLSEAWSSRYKHKLRVKNAYYMSGTWNVPNIKI
jgi:hypothetical protein